MTNISEYANTSEFLYCHTHICDLLKKKEKEGAIESFQYELNELMMYLSTELIFNQKGGRDESNIISFVYIISSHLHNSVRPTTIEECATAICREMHDGYGDFESPEFRKMLKTLFKIVAKTCYGMGDSRSMALFTELVFLFR